MSVQFSILGWLCTNNDMGPGEWEGVDDWPKRAVLSFLIHSCAK